MDEIEEKRKELEALKNSDDGDKPEELSAIKRANEAAERLEKATALEKENLDRRERMVAEERLGGRTDVMGKKPTDDRTQDQKDIEYANQITKGELSVEDVLMPEEK